MSGFDLGYGGPAETDRDRFVFHSPVDSMSEFHPIPAAGSASGVVRSIQ